MCFLVSLKKLTFLVGAFNLRNELISKGLRCLKIDLNQYTKYRTERRFCLCETRTGRIVASDTLWNVNFIIYWMFIGDEGRRKWTLKTEDEHVSVERECRLCETFLHIFKWLSALGCLQERALNKLKILLLKTKLFRFMQMFYLQFLAAAPLAQKIHIHASFVNTN